MGLRISTVVGLAISRAVLTGADVAIGLFRLSLWKVVTSFEKCWIANAGSQIFFSSE